MPKGPAIAYVPPDSDNGIDNVDSWRDVPLLRMAVRHARARGRKVPKDAADRIRGASVDADVDADLNDLLTRVEGGHGGAGSVSPSLTPILPPQLLTRWSPPCWSPSP